MIARICPPIIATNPPTSTAREATIIAGSIWSKFERALIIYLTRICRKPSHDQRGHKKLFRESCPRKLSKSPFVVPAEYEEYVQPPDTSNLVQRHGGD